MDIKTKFNIGDTAYFLDEYNRLVECKVVEMAIAISKPSIYVSRDLEYIVKYYDCEELTHRVKAPNLYALPKELFEALNKSMIKFYSEINAVCKHIINVGVERGRCRISRCIWDDSID